MPRRSLISSPSPANKNSRRRTLNSVEKKESTRADVSVISLSEKTLASPMFFRALRVSVMVFFKRVLARESCWRSGFADHNG